MSITMKEVCDLYNIPNDDRKEFRLNKFVEYQHEVPSIHYRFVGEFIRMFNVPKEDVIWLAWMLSVTYNELTTLLLYFVIKDKKNYDYKKLWEEHKQDLIFGSAKLWNKRKDLFAPLMIEFNNITNFHYLRWLEAQITNEPSKTYKNIYYAITSIKNASRLSADFFLEQIVYLKDYLGIEIEEPLNIDWGKSANLTSGILNIFYQDDKANEFDKTGKIYDKDFLYKGLLKIQSKIKEVYPEQNSEIPAFIGKICSFRNLFKGARYAGFHHDRELEQLKEYEKKFPEFKALWDLCYRIRKRIFQHRFLGELNGWDGIRKERKKIWLKYGLTGAENETKTFSDLRMPRSR